MRLEVSRRADLAGRALQVLAAADGRVKATALAEALGTTSGFVAQVMAPLVQQRWVRSEPGPTGGYAARAGVHEVSVLAVIEAVDGATDRGRCVVEAKECDGSRPCALHQAWSAARSGLMDSLAATPVTSAFAADRAG